MTLAERRAMVEILLCGDLSGCLTSAINLGEPRELAVRCSKIREQIFRDAVGRFTFRHSGIEAAYRLIEASPTLVREFFGRCTHPRSEHELTWGFIDDPNDGMRQQIVAAKCGRCGDALKVTKPDGTVISQGSCP